MPTTWDDTKAVNGQIGDHVTVARKSGHSWYVGRVTDENARSLPVPRTFLDGNRPYVATIYGDAPTTDLGTNPDQVEITQVLVRSHDTLVARLAAGGGQAVTLERATDSQLRILPTCGETTPLCQLGSR